MDFYIIGRSAHVRTRMQKAAYIHTYWPADTSAPGRLAPQKGNSAKAGKIIKAFNASDLSAQPDEQGPKNQRRPRNASKTHTHSHTISGRRWFCGVFNAALQPRVLGACCCSSPREAAGKRQSKTSNFNGEAGYQTRNSLSVFGLTPPFWFHRPRIIT